MPPFVAKGPAVMLLSNPTPATLPLEEIYATGPGILIEPRFFDPRMRPNAAKQTT
jgi:hypothetical protein